MTEAIETALIAFLGTAVGAMSSIATMVVQSRRNATLELKKLAVQMAFDDYHHRLDNPTKYEYVPATALVYYYDGIVRLATRGELNIANVKTLLHDEYQMAVAQQKEGEKLRQKS